jgi:hypothetical protein
MAQIIKDTTPKLGSREGFRSDEGNHSVGPAAENEAPPMKRVERSHVPSPLRQSSVPTLSHPDQIFSDTKEGYRLDKGYHSVGSVAEGEILSAAKRVKHSHAPAALMQPSVPSPAPPSPNPHARPGFRRFTPDTDSHDYLRMLQDICQDELEGKRCQSPTTCSARWTICTEWEAVSIIPKLRRLC